MVDTTISPIQDFTTVKEGVGDNLLANVFSAGTEILGAFSDAGKDKKKNVFLADFETRQISLIDSLDQGAPGVTSAITRSRLRANYTAAITEFPQLRGDIETVYSGILSRNGLGAVGQSLTPEEKREQETLGDMNNGGFIPVGGFSDVNEQAEAVGVFRRSLQAQADLAAFTAGVSAQQASLNLTSSQNAANDAKIARLSNDVIRTGAPAEFLRLTNRLDEIRNSIGTDGYDLTQALKDMELEKLGFEQMTSELKAMQGADTTLIDALSKPIESLFELQRSLADNTIDTEAANKQMEIIMAYNELQLMQNPTVAFILAVGSLSNQIPTDLIMTLNTEVGKITLDSIAAGISGGTTDVVNEGIKPYLDLTRTWLRDSDSYSDAQKLEVASQVNAVLEGITTFSKTYYKDPATAKYFMDFLSSDEFGSYTEGGTISPDLLAGAQEAVEAAYIDTVAPLIRQSFTSNNIDFSTFVDIGVTPFGFEGVQQRSAAGNILKPSESPTPSVIEAVVDSEGIHFQVKAGVAEFNERNAAERRARELNKEIGPAINLWVKGVAHVGGTKDYEAVMSRALQSLTGQAPEGLDIQGLLDSTGAPTTALDLADRVIQQESGGDANAVNPSTEASGLMQVMRDTARDPGFGVKPLAWEDRFDPRENVRFGTEYLQAMLDKFDGDQVRALAAYNWGPGNAERWSGDFNDLPAETRDYINRILGTNS